MLRKFSCRVTEDSREAIANISKVVSLEELCLYGETDGNLEYDASPLAQLQLLQELTLGMGRWHGLGHLKSCSKLFALDLEDAKANDAALRQFDKLPLKKLNLGDSGITDSGAEALGSCLSLETLTFRNTQITSAGLRSLLRIPKLTVLMLWDLKIDALAVDILSQMAELRGLYLSDPACPTNLRRKLDFSLPNCRIDWRDVDTADQNED